MTHIPAEFFTDMDDSTIELITGFIESIPFLEPISDVVHTFLNVSSNPGNRFELTKDYIVQEFFQFALLAFLKPSVQRRMFTRDESTVSFSYRIRVVILNLILFPLLAVFTNWVSTVLLQTFIKKLGEAQAYIAIIGVTSGLLLLSAIPIMISKSFIFGIAWTALYKVPSEFVNIVFTGCMCYGIFVSLALGIPDHILWQLPVLFFGLTFFAWIFHSIQLFLVCFSHK